MKVRRWVRLCTSVTVSAIVATGIAAASAPGAAAASIGDLVGAGPRPNATRLSFSAGDRVKAQVDVGSGNLLVQLQGLSLQGVGSSVPLSGFYNSAAAASTPVPRLGKGWGLNTSTDIRVAKQSDNSVTFYGPDGLVGNFPLVSGSTTAYTSAPGFKSDLVKTSSGWDLTERGSRTKRSFDSTGALTSVTDRNGNSTTVTASTGATSFPNLTVLAPAGPAPARTATVQTTTGGVTTVRQPNVTSPRQVSFATVSGVMTQATDPLGRTTSFTYDASGLLTKITAPGGALGAITGFGYDSSKRVTTITQTESSGTPGNSTTRLLYQDTSTTLMASPTTNQAAAVADVPHTTYTLDSSDRVTNVVDAQGRPQAKTYTANFDTLTSAVGLTGSQSTTTNVYGANGGESLTKSTSQTGASTSIGYTNPSPNQYLPSKGTDDAGNASTYTFNGAGNQLSSSDALAARADVTYNTDGTPATAKSPNNGTNTTKYAYNDKQVAAITPVTGTNLGVRNYTYDQYGRLATSTDGRGVTTTLGYDPNDRLTSVGYSDGTGIAFTYSAAGQLETRTDSTGTTRYGYDQLGRTLLIQNSAFGGTVTYTYDRDSRLATTGNPATGGTVTYHYDPAGKVTSIDYPSGGATKSMVFYTDSHSRRADTWMNANPTHTTWTAHTHNSYDGSDRVSRVTSDVGTGDSSNSRVVDISYCYVFNTTPGSTCTANPTYDRNKLVWKKNNLTGDITAYSYDTSGRLKLATVSGSTAKTFTYTYNANGNRLTAAGTGQTAQTLTFNAANQITTASYTYDGAGNLTAHPKVGGSAATMTYTGDDQLKTVTKSGTTYQYKYGGRGNDELIYQTTPKGTYQYAYGRDDSQGVPTLEQVDKDGQTASVISDPNTGQPLMLNTSSGLQALLVYDGRPGSPIALLTSTGQVGIAYDYNPFGVPTLTTNTNTEVLDQNPYGFATGIQDRTTGWVHYSARYYDPTTAAFTQQDAVDAPLDPTNGNRYAYAGNDPINNTDPAGRRSCAGAVAIAAANYVGFNLAAAGSILIIPTGVGIPIAVGSILLTGVLLAYSFEDAYEACK